MATIALYANRLNQMPELIKDVKKSVKDYKSELSTLKTKVMTIDSSVCDLYDVISSIQASTQLQEEKIESLENFQKNSEEFISEVIRIDNDVEDIVKKRKEDFYGKYEYLKPECEKSLWEKAKDTCKKVGEWCKEHWKLIVTVVIVVVSVALICTGVGAILTGACWGAIIGAGIGGVSGGMQSVANGGSFWEGFENGAFEGAVSGAITGAAFAGVNLAGQALGKGISCVSNLGKAVKTVSAVSGIISFGMSGFDTLALLDMVIDPTSNPIAELNSKAHSSELYNVAQVGISLVATLTGGMTKTMACFVAGTMILTASGLVAIENIKAGDKVISTNVDTFETAEKTVVETYVREVSKFVHLTINNELIITTVDHPFYVKEYGFINAGELLVGDKVVNANGETYRIESIYIETTETPVMVYNFQVEDFHTYHVGESGVLVHNADYKAVKSRIGENSGLVKEAEKAGKNQQVQKEMNHLINEFLSGNSNPGIGSKNLFKDIFYLRGRNGARVFYRVSDNVFEILGKANKGNEQIVINILKNLFGG